MQRVAFVAYKQPQTRCRQWQKYNTAPHLLGKHGKKLTVRFQLYGQSACRLAGKCPAPPRPYPQVFSIVRSKMCPASFGLLYQAVAHVCVAIGFTSTTPGALECLTDVVSAPPCRKGDRWFGFWKWRALSLGGGERFIWTCDVTRGSCLQNLSLPELRVIREHSGSSSDFNPRFTPGFAALADVSAKRMSLMCGVVAPLDERTTWCVTN